MNETEQVPEAEEDKGAFRATFAVPQRYKRPASWATHLARSKFATLMLLLAEVITGTVCIGILSFGVVILCNGLIAGDTVKTLCALFGTPVAFTLQFATFVVFARVAEL
ncbi:MAG: hypothetical protein ACYSWU_03490 [Planctomycetota bacterium]|jgi:hypothetical protein